MGIKLMVEIFDHWQDAGLTLGERSDLLVLAENANDRTRETWPKGGVHQEYIRKRAGKTAGSWKNAIAKLIKKGVLAYAVHDGRELTGFPGQAAVYRIVPLCPEAPHDGLMGQCTRTERSTPTVTLSEGDEPGKGHLSEGKGHLPEEKGHLPEGERSTPTMTPTPPYPSSRTPFTTPSSPAEPVEPEPPVAPDVTDGGGGDHALRATAVHIADHLDYRGKPPTKAQRETIVDRLVIWLEAGWSAGGLAVVLDITGQEIQHAPTVYAHRLDPEQMPPPEAAAPAAAGGVRGPVLTGAQVEALTYDDVFGPARGAGYQSYRNPVDQSVYDAPWPMSTADKRVAQAAALAAQLQAEDAADLPPWCGNYDCDPVTRTRDGRDDNGLPFVYPCVVCHPERAAA